jgi:hypothetical protein
MSYEASATVVMIKSKSSTMSIVYILVKVSLDFFQKVGFMGETFLFFKGSSSSAGSLGGVTSPCFCWSSFLFVSSTSSSPPHSGDIEAVPSDALLNFWTSSVFFLLFGPGQSFASSVVPGLSISLGSEISVGSAGMRSYVDQSLVISSRSSSMSF